MLFLTRKYRKQLFRELETLRKSGATIDQMEGVIKRLCELEAKMGEAQAKLQETASRNFEQIAGQVSDIRKDLSAEVKTRSVQELTDADNYVAHNPEVGLMEHLYSFLPNRTCVDIGANIGDFSERLLAAGYRVFAFEPFPPVFDKLSKRLQSKPEFRGYPFAVGAADAKMPLHIVTDHTGGQYDDPTLYSTLMPHAIMAGMAFAKSVEVPVRSLDSLHQSGELPAQVDLLKIDTEGFDLEVIRGMGNHRYPVVSAEFWDPEYVCGRSGTLNRLDELTSAMKARGYHWHIVIYRVEGSYDISFYCHRNKSVKKSWGNVFFFQDHNLFQRALEWCSSLMPETRFV